MNKNKNSDLPTYESKTRNLQPSEMQGFSN